LATDFGDMKKYFTDGTDIIMAECSNPASIAHKIKWMLLNPLELNNIAERGHKRAIELLEFRKSIRRIAGLLE